MNLLRNGEFAGNLAYWTSTGAIARNLGFPRLGCAQLAAGQTLTQELALGQDALYTLHYFYQVATGATLTAGFGAITQAQTGTPLSVWREGVLPFALDASATDDVSFSAAGGSCYVDSVTLLAGGLAKSRADLATELAARLGAIATDAALSLTPSSSGPEGDYTAAIDEALRAVGAINRFGDPDITALGHHQVNDLLEAAKTGMLQRVRAKYALEVDVSLGPRSESRSQIAGSIDEMLAGAGGSRRVTMGKLSHGDWRR